MMTDMGASNPTPEPERYCLHCGYNLHGLENPRCPECGKWFVPHIPATYETEPPSFRRWLRRSRRSIEKTMLIVLGSLLFIVLCFSFCVPHLGSRAPSPRSISASNARGLAKACRSYAAEHQGNFPDDLGVLYKEGLISLKQCKNPLSDTPAPPADLTIAQLANWINQHSDYVYLRPGRNSSPGRPEILLFEKIENNTPEFVAVAFTDASSKILSVSEFLNELVKMLQHQTIARATQPAATQPAVK